MMEGQPFNLRLNRAVMGHVAREWIAPTLAPFQKWSHHGHHSLTKAKHGKGRKEGGTVTRWRVLVQDVFMIVYMI